MSETVVIEIARETIQVSLMLAAPLLVVSLLTGLLISLFQVATSLQDVTLTFVPKIVAAGLILLVFGSWMIQQLTTWVTGLWAMIPGIL